MDMISLSAAPRVKDVSPRQLRRSGSVPCVVYGNTENTSLQIPEMPITKAYARAGESTLVELEWEGKKLPVLFHEVTFDPVTDRVSHVDFFAVDMKKEVEADVPVHLEGESLAVKEAGAILVTPLDHVEVRCLPKDLPHHLVANLSLLTEVGSSITVAQLDVPSGVTILTSAETVIAIAQEQREEEVEVVPVAAVEGAVPADGAAPAEGAPAADGAAPAEGAAAPEAKKK